MRKELQKMAEQRFAIDKRWSLQPVNCENRNPDDPPGPKPPPPPPTE